MSLSKKLVIFISLLYLGTTSASAVCIRSSTATVQLDMAMGRIVVNSDSPVGSVIATQSWNMPIDSSISYQCTDTTVFRAKIVAPGITDLGNKIYSTNVPGIGIRFSYDNSTNNIIYPGSFTARNGNFSLEESRFTLEIIKTAVVTGSGTLKAGKYATYGLENDNNPIIEIILGTNAITVVSPSCTILSSKNMNVDVGIIKRSDLSGIGSTAGGKDFNIELQCSGGLSEFGYANIQASFSGPLTAGTDMTNGVLLNEKNGTSRAQGIGIQVLKDGLPLEFNKKYSIGSLRIQGIRYITIPLHARFYQYGAATSTGEVESHMIFSLTYD